MPHVIIMSLLRSSDAESPKVACSMLRAARRIRPPGILHTPGSFLTQKKSTVAGAFLHYHTSESLKIFNFLLVNLKFGHHFNL